MLQITDSLKINNLAQKYFLAKKELLELGYLDEIIWQDEIGNFNITKEILLSEFAWVVLSSGMRESVIRNKFNDISKIFYDWHNTTALLNNKDICLKKALRVFNNEKKILAIIEFAEFLDKHGSKITLQRINEEKQNFLMKFSFLGPTTSLHFLKNIGFNTAKPDRHLIRISNVYGFSDPNEMCLRLSRVIDESVPVIDLVLWRFAERFRNYVVFFSGESSDFLVENTSQLRLNLKT
ncbi:hypothetical protein [Ekhidna sp.]|uniref:hypothetical protein n=1 Tax=Ekhidna sp. TaxID=2608089 RepID=UPI003298B858